MAGIPFAPPNESIQTNEKVKRQADKIVDDVKKIQSAYWKL
jgi:hypothetical protein